MNDTIDGAMQVCSFRLGKLLFGIDVLSVQEVIKYRPLTPVPLAPGSIEGLLNLRGQILTALDLRLQLELPDSEKETAKKMLIIVKTDSVEAALLVDSVGEVIDVTSDTFEVSDTNVPEKVRPYIIGVHNLKDQILHLLDPEKTASLSTSKAI